MSSPIAKARKTGVDQVMIATHKRLSHSRRIEQLAIEFAARIQAIESIEGRQRLSVLDVGCGDMTLADAIERRLPNVDLRCVDIHPCPDELVHADPRWRRYMAFDGRTLPFEPAAFDAVIFSDVLHHVPPLLRVDLLRSAARVGRYVIIKDHLEYGWWSRQVLRAMDLVGNFAYGVEIPRRYFNHETWGQLCNAAQIHSAKLDVGLQLYAHLPVVRMILSPRWQFFAVCEGHSRTA